MATREAFLEEVGLQLGDLGLGEVSCPCWSRAEAGGLWLEGWQEPSCR